MFQRVAVLGVLVIIGVSCGDDSNGSGPAGGSGGAGAKDGSGAVSGAGGSGATGMGGTDGGGVSGSAGSGGAGAAGLGGDAGNAVYPECLTHSGGSYIISYACEATHECLASCDSCAGAELACVVVGGGANGAVDSWRCVSACASCSQGSLDAGGYAFPDECPGRCTNLTKDNQNCGSCGHACSSGALCDQGHCCGKDPSGNSMYWNSTCNACCPDAVFCNQPSLCVPPG